MQVTGMYMCMNNNEKLIVIYNFEQHIYNHVIKIKMKSFSGYHQGMYMFIIIIIKMRFIERIIN